VAEVNVRRARAGDGEDLARVWLDNASYYCSLDPGSFRVPERDGLGEWMERGLKNPPQGEWITLVGQLDGRTVGFLEAHLVGPIEDADKQMVTELGEMRLVVNALGVEQAFWRQGVATALMNEAEQWGRAKGATLVSVETNADSPVSVPFYEQGVAYRRAHIGFRKRLD
jgi:GNAT superfamily N-acetyltransferase